MGPGSSVAPLSVFGVGAAAVRIGLSESGAPMAMLVLSTASASQTLGESLFALRVGSPRTIAKRTAPDGVVATYVPSRSGCPETRPVKRKRFGPVRAGTSSRPALRQTGATCLSRIATGPDVDERNASTTVGRRFAARSEEHTSELQS